MLGLVTQLWHQSPIIFVMVVSLVLFGTYAATAPLREDDVDGAYATDTPSDSIRT